MNFSFSGWSFSYQILRFTDLYTLSKVEDFIKCLWTRYLTSASLCNLTSKDTKKGCLLVLTYLFSLMLCARFKVSAWRNFKNIFPRPLFIIIFRPEMLIFHPYSILTLDTRIEFVISCMLIGIFYHFDFWPLPGKFYNSLPDLVMVIFMALISP